MIGNTKTLINHRLNNIGNDTAAEYIKQKFIRFGLPTIDQVYSVSGRNIYAIQQGLTNPNQKYIISAHYDAPDYYSADDDASGTAAVIEAARILSKYSFKNTIIYALWDEEELGLLGSKYFSDSIAKAGSNLLGVLNLEMFGWDSNYDMTYEIHTDTAKSSRNLAHFLATINSIYSLSLSPIIDTSGNIWSDHSRFLANGFSAIVVSEAFFNGDGNPYYHTPYDRIDKFNLPYFYALSKLAIGSIASLAIEYTTSSDEITNVSNEIKIVNYPNPFNNETTISFALPETDNVRLDIYSYVGVHVTTLFNQTAYINQEYKIKFNSSSLSSGLYFGILQTSNKRISKKMLIVK